MTDYAADSLMNYQPDTYTSYQDIVDAGFIYDTLDIDAVIKTDVYDKYPNIFDDWNKYRSNSTMKNILCSTYGYTYSINPNFKQDYFKEHKKTDAPFVNVNKSSIINSMNLTLSSTFSGFTFEDGLQENELHLDYTIYNRYFAGKYNLKNLDTFTGDTFRVVLQDGEDKVLIDKTFKVTKLYVKSHYYDQFHISKSLYDEVLEPMTFAYQTSLYTDKGDIYKFVDILMETEGERVHFSFRGTEQTLMYSTLQLFATFRKIFEFISFLLVAAIFLIIILNANTLIKHNVYEIGLMKAFGAKTRNLVSMFTTQMVFTSLVVCLLLFTSSQIFINFADNLLKEGIAAYTSSANEYMNFNTFVFSTEYFWLNILIIAASTILSVVVPILAVRRIKPLTIIRTRN